MSKPDLKIELEQRYCPSCNIETRHAVLYQLTFGRRGREIARDEQASGCAICNPDRFWGLKLTTSFNQEKFLVERWLPRSS